MACYTRRQPDPLDSTLQSDFAAPRDIKGKRTKFMPLTPGDLQTLIGIGLIEMRDEIPKLTSEGYRAID